MFLGLHVAEFERVYLLILEKGDIFCLILHILMMVQFGQYIPYLVSLTSLNGMHSFPEIPVHTGTVASQFTLCFRKCIRHGICLYIHNVP